MPRFGSVSRRDLIRYLRQLGFSGPYPGGKHSFMVRDGRRLNVPNPHRGNISVQLLAELLRKAAINREEWERL
jgi:predicted RNA binding protein YcfA (HicA-like mRNA interferase family)